MAAGMKGEYSGGNCKMVASSKDGRPPGPIPCSPPEGERLVLESIANRLSETSELAKGVRNMAEDKLCAIAGCREQCVPGTDAFAGEGLYAFMEYELQVLSQCLWEIRTELERL